MNIKLLIATHNTGKIREYVELLVDLPFQITSLRAENITHDVAETGNTFTENARLKAQSYAEMSGLWTWADDSGLEVDALDGRPGIFSARYGGAGLTSEQRYLKVLDELQLIAPERRTARFRCVVALAIPDRGVYTVEDTVEGCITHAPRGQHGFGYDPIFYMPEFKATMAELPAEIKNRISHRGKAAQQAKSLLREII
jgi:XTP/dITP diphosphohydrolase